MKKETGGKASMMDLLERKLDKKSEQGISDQGISSQDTSSQDIPSQVISSQVTSQDSNIDLNKSISPKVGNNALVHESVRIAFRERPRVSFWSPKVSAIMHYLKKTVPDFSKSKEVETLLDEALAKKYPELYKLITEEIAKGN